MSRGPRKLKPHEHGNEYCHRCRATRMFIKKGFTGTHIRCGYCGRIMEVVREPDGTS